MNGYQQATASRELPRRFLEAAELPEGGRPGPLVNLRDAAAFAAFNAYSAIEPLRKLAGANPDTGYNPEVTPTALRQPAALYVK